MIYRTQLPNFMPRLPVILIMKRQLNLANSRSWFIVLGSYDTTMTQEALTDNYGRVVSYQYPAKFEINIRVVDAMTGKIVETVKVLARAKEGEQSRSYEKLKEDVIRKLEREVSNKYPLVGYVIKVLGEDDAT